MSNVANIALKAGEFTVKVSDLLKEMGNPESEYADLFAIGEGKGIPFELKPDEVLTFEPFEKTDLIVRVSTLDGKSYKLLSVLVESSLRGKNIEVPLSIFRRTPALQEDRDKLIKDSPLTERLLQSSLSDFARLQIIAGKKVKADVPFNMAKVMFKVVNGKPTRVDVSELDPKDRKTMLFWQVSFA